LQHIAPLRTERHANPDFVGALPDAVGNHAGYSDHRQKHSESRKHRQQHGIEPRLGRRIGNVLLHRLDRVYRDILVNRAHLFGHRGGQALRRQSRSDRHRHQIKRQLRVQQVNLRERVLL